MTMWQVMARVITKKKVGIQVRKSDAYILLAT